MSCQGLKEALKPEEDGKKVLKAAKGYRGGHSKQYRTAENAVMRAGMYEYRDRRVRKRDFRKLWIIRINAAARAHGISYSRLMAALTKAGVVLDRKVLADMAVNDPAGFSRLAAMAL
mgnify:CR=1 FL=1